MHRILAAIAAATLLTAGLVAGLAALNPFSGWPTTCVELNDIVEGHLGHEDNVGIYPRVFDDPAHAEAACQADHQFEVRDAFGWAFSNPDPNQIVGGSDFSTGEDCRQPMGFIPNDLFDQICYTVTYSWWPSSWTMSVQWMWPDGSVIEWGPITPCTEPAYCGFGRTTVVWNRGDQGNWRQPNGLLWGRVYVNDRYTGQRLAGPIISVIDIYPFPHGPLAAQLPLGTRFEVSASA